MGHDKAHRLYLFQAGRIDVLELHPVTPDIARSVPQTLARDIRTIRGMRIAGLTGLFLAMVGLACAWNPEYRGQPDAEYDALSLQEYASGEQFGEMTAETQERFKAEIRSYWQSPYLWGGNAPSGVDCSGLIGQIYRNAAAIELPRTTLGLFASGMPVEDKPLQFGDLVFFSLGPSRQPDHVGFYVARGFFIHASVSSGVTLSLITDQPYRNSYRGARRLLQ
jgi:hypothetical protein